VLKKLRRVKDEVLGWIVGKPQVIGGGAFVWRFCTRHLSAKLHIDAHPKLIVNSPKWENHEEKSRSVFRDHKQMRIVLSRVTTAKPESLQVELQAK